MPFVREGGRLIYWCPGHWQAWSFEAAGNGSPLPLASRSRRFTSDKQLGPVTGVDVAVYWGRGARPLNRDLRQVLGERFSENGLFVRKRI